MIEYSKDFDEFLDYHEDIYLTSDTTNVIILEDLVIFFGDCWWCYHIARFIECVDIQRLQKTIAKNGDTRWSKKFDRLLKDKVEYLVSI